MKFKTSDGYTLYRQGETWVDSLDPETLDMTFDSGPDGLPVDHLGEVLDGEVVEEEREPCCPTCPGWGVLEAGNGTLQVQRCDACHRGSDYSDSDALIEALAVLRGTADLQKIYPCPTYIRAAVIGDMLAQLHAPATIIAGVQDTAQEWASRASCSRPTGPGHISAAQEQKLLNLGWLIVEDEGDGTYLGRAGDSGWSVYVTPCDYSKLHEYIPGYAPDAPSPPPATPADIADIADTYGDRWASNLK